MINAKIQSINIHHYLNYQKSGMNNSILTNMEINIQERNSVSNLTKYIKNWTQVIILWIVYNNKIFLLILILTYLFWYLMSWMYPKNVNILLNKTFFTLFIVLYLTSFINKCGISTLQFNYLMYNIFFLFGVYCWNTILKNTI